MQRKLSVYHKTRVGLQITCIVGVTEQTNVKIKKEIFSFSAAARLTSQFACKVINSSALLRRCSPQLASRLRLSFTSRFHSTSAAASVCVRACAVALGCHRPHLLC
ncbi:unnamed protein product [Citrullus colocynthis]|uniref:Uncharacterized protein n=1 Tax=Citrullus colocynthis TaxID=252529 RepID=A0ABP0Y5G7_9ROSI